MLYKHKQEVRNGLHICNPIMHIYKMVCLKFFLNSSWRCVDTRKLSFWERSVCTPCRARFCPFFGQVSCYRVSWAPSYLPTQTWVSLSALFILSCGIGDPFLFFSLVVGSGIQFPKKGLNLGPLHWECRISATRPPGKSLQYPEFAVPSTHRSRE